MFTTVVPLNKETHKDLKLNQMTDLSFSENLNMIPLGFTEFFRAARYYPIVFTLGENPQAMALLSLQKEQNHFVDSAGKWKVPYVPTHIRRYPFILGKSVAAKDGENDTEDGENDTKDRFALCIDREADCFSEDEGQPLFQEDGSPSETTEKALEFLQKFQAEINLTMQYIKVLQENDCLKGQQLNMKVDGEDRTLGTFQVADLDKLKELSEETLADFVKKGYLALMYAQNFSIANLDRFVGDIQTRQVVKGNDTIH